jgi:cytochrome c oxidase cbb3-type subunit III
MTTLKRSGLGALALAAIVIATSCSREREPPAQPVPHQTGSLLQVTVTGIEAGGASPAPEYQNPYEGNVHALKDGERIYTWFNCHGCHGAVGGGGMGPPLADEDWIYGNTPAHIYSSIMEGRPQGMPSFRGLLSEDEAWKLVAHVRSLGPKPGTPPGSADPTVSKRAQPEREEMASDVEE